MVDQRNPYPTVDIIIDIAGEIVWISRANAPHGWALPDGYVDAGESVEQAAIREAKEETGLDITLCELFYVYSHPSRDPRQHNLSVVFIAEATGDPSGADDATEAGLFALTDPPSPVAFDHLEIIDDYRSYLATGERPAPIEYLRKHEPTL